jgi:hypothetical protein
MTFHPSWKFENRYFRKNYTIPNLFCKREWYIRLSGSKLNYFANQYQGNVNASDAAK